MAHAIDDRRSTTGPRTDLVYQRCIVPGCGGTAGVEDTAFVCPQCGGLLDVAYDWDRLPPPRSLRAFEAKWAERTNPLCFSGVWRFRELLPFARPEDVLTIGEGQTILQKADAVAGYVGLGPGRLFLQYEGLNPSGSFKDNGMTAAFTHARMAGANRAACASTGNTSASLAVFCSATGLMKAVVFIGSGKISYGKLAQALDHGALTVQIAGDFDDAMQRVQQVSRRLGIYLVNSINPFRLEGQKTVMYRVLEALAWEPPDWIVRRGGNLGNVTAFGKAILDAKAKVGAGGLGCEPASAASVAGARKLRQEGVIAAGESVVAVLTGHQLKDPTATMAYHSTDPNTFDEVLGKRGVKRASFANRAIQVSNDLDEIVRAIELYS